MKSITEIYDMLTEAGRALAAYRGDPRAVLAVDKAHKFTRDARLELAPLLATPYAHQTEEAS